MFNNFLMKQMLKSKMKDVPPEQQEKILEIFEKNPELLSTIAKEAMEKTKQGKSQMDAIMEVIKGRESEIKDAFK